MPTIFSTLARDVEMVESIDDVCAPAAADSQRRIEKQLFSTMRATLVDDRTVHVWFECGEEFNAVDRQVGVGLRVTVVTADGEAASMPCWTTTERNARDESPTRGLPWRLRPLWIELGEGSRIADGKGETRVKVWVAAEPRLALRDLETTEYWWGNFTATVRVR